MKPIEEGGLARTRNKEKNFVREQEEQLCCSVLHVSHKRITRNQQKTGVF